MDQQKLAVDEINYLGLVKDATNIFVPSYDFEAKLDYLKSDSHLDGTKILVASVAPPYLSTFLLNRLYSACGSGGHSRLRLVPAPTLPGSLGLARSLLLPIPAFYAMQLYFQSIGGRLKACQGRNTSNRWIGPIQA